MRKLLTVIILLGLGTLGYAQWFLPSQIESSENINLPHEPYVITDEAERFHRTLFVADLHSDSLLWKRDLRRRSDVGHMDLPRLRDGNVALQVFSATTKSPKGQNYARNEADSDRIRLLAMASLWPPRTWDSIYERAVYQLEKLEELASDSNLTMIRNASDLQALIAHREQGGVQTGAIYLIEGAHPLEGKLENLDSLFRMGLRIVGLTHFFDNELGGSLHGVSRAGLSEFGRSVVRRANQLDMIIDVAHASEAMVEDVLEMSSRPVIVSHTGLKGICNTPRNISDDLMQEIAGEGGLIGIGFWDAAVCDVSPRGVVKAIRYAINLVGVRHVALGSDYDGATAVTFDAGELAILTQEMLDAGFSDREIRLVMGENVKRFLLKYLPASN